MKKQVEFYEDFIALQTFHKRLIQSSGNQSISGVFFSDFFQYLSKLRLEKARISLLGSHFQLRIQIKKLNIYQKFLYSNIISCSHLNKNLTYCYCSYCFLNKPINNFPLWSVWVKNQQKYFIKQLVDNIISHLALIQANFI